MFGILEPPLFPVLATVTAAVHTRAITDVPAADVLAGTHPDRARIRGIDRDGADRVGVFVLEDRCPGRALVNRLPHAAAADAHIPGALVIGVDGDIGDASRHERRPDASHLQAFEGLLVESGIELLIVLGNRGRRQAAKYGGE